MLDGILFTIYMTCSIKYFYNMQSEEKYINEYSFLVGIITLIIGIVFLIKIMIFLASNFEYKK